MIFRGKIVWFINHIFSFIWIDRKFIESKILENFTQYGATHRYKLAGNSGCKMIKDGEGTASKAYK